MKRLHLAVIAVVLLSFIALGLHNITTNKNRLKLKDIQLKSTSANLKQLELKYDNLNLELDKADKNNKQQLQDLDKQKQDLQQQLDKAQKDLQSRAAAKAYAATLHTTPVAYAASVGCTDAKSCIYFHESGGRTTATNGGGCYGIGQDCNGIVRNLCGADYACQDQYFTGYMTRRYGTWAAAWSFWQAQCPTVKGCWW